MKQSNVIDTAPKNTPDKSPAERSVIVIIDGRVVNLTREQEALIRSWASGPV